MALPQLTTGHSGVVGFDDMNAVFRHVEKADDLNEALPFKKPGFEFLICKLEDAQAISGAIRKCKWTGQKMVSSAFVQTTEGVPYSSTQAGDPFALGAIVVHPPFAFVFFTKDQTARQQAYVFRPSSLHDAKITQVFPGPDPLNLATYSAMTVDNGIIVTNLAPFRQIPGTKYMPASVGSPCTIAVNDEGTTRIQDVQETFDTTTCDPAATSFAGRRTNYL